MTELREPGWLVRTPNGVRLTLRVVPRASRNSVEAGSGQSLRIRVTCAPEKGKANAAAVKLLAKHLGVAASSCRITRGTTSRDKQVEVVGLTIREAIDALSA